MHALSLALRGERLQISPRRCRANRKLLYYLGHTQTSLPREKGKDLFLSFWSRNKIAHNRSQSVINNHSTFYSNFKRHFGNMRHIPPTVKDNSSDAWMSVASSNPVGAAERYHFLITSNLSSNDEVKFSGFTPAQQRGNQRPKYPLQTIERGYDF